MSRPGKTYYSYLSCTGEWHKTLFYKIFPLGYLNGAQKHQKKTDLSYSLIQRKDFFYLGIVKVPVSLVCIKAESRKPSLHLSTGFFSPRFYMKTSF